MARMVYLQMGPTALFLHNELASTYIVIYCNKYPVPGPPYGGTDARGSPRSIRCNVRQGVVSEGARTIDFPYFVR